jgi:subtilisin family serine protease
MLKFFKYVAAATVACLPILSIPYSVEVQVEASPTFNSPVLENVGVSNNRNSIDVYVLDSGYSFQAELPKNVRSFTSIDFTEEKGSLNQFKDCSGHGTVVASVLAEEAFASDVDINLYSLKVFGCEETASVTDTVGIYRGLTWILDNTEDGDTAAINMSLSFLAESEALESKVSELIERGFIIVTSAGNNGSDACELSPGRIDGVVTVGNIRIKPSNNESVVIESSNVGDCVDLYSRGTYICQVSDRMGKSCGGTSFAAPIVSARIAKYLSLNSELTSANTVELLKLDSEYSASGKYYYLPPSEHTVDQRYYSIPDVEFVEELTDTLGVENSAENLFRIIG